MRLEGVEELSPAGVTRGPVAGVRSLGADGFIAPRWSPDGEMLAASSPKFKGIYLIHPESGRVEVLTEEDSAGYGFAWSPDSKQIAYKAVEGKGRFYRKSIRVVNLQTKSIRTVSRLGDRVGLPSWRTGRGYSQVGGRYGFYDAGVINGTTYYYVLEEVEYSGGRNHYGPVDATPHVGEGSPYIVSGTYDFFGEAGFDSPAARVQGEEAEAEQPDLRGERGGGLVVVRPGLGGDGVMGRWGNGESMIHDPRGEEADTRVDNQAPTAVVELSRASGEPQGEGDLIYRTLSSDTSIEVGAEVVEVRAGEALVFDGSESFDPDGDALYYLWEVVYKPLGSEARFSDQWAAETVFFPDLTGDYELRLTVHDGQAWSEPAVVVLLALEADEAGDDLEPLYGGCNIIDLGGTAATSLLPIFLAFIALRRWKTRGRH